VSFKNCPFCGGGDITPVLYDNAGMCEDCGATCNHHWNTRAAPTMKQWEWDESNSHGRMFKCKTFDAVICSEFGEWRSQVIGNLIKYSATIADAQAACVAYVEGKLKEWLVS